MPSRLVGSWGNVLRDEHETACLRSRFDSFPALRPGSSVLPFGNGRSYGDSCLNFGGTLLEMRSLDRFIAFNRESGRLTCEAGVLLEEILQLVVPAGWFPAVVPGTQYVTVGGAIANDVHGKNHHRLGTFGCHVRRFELLRSTGERLVCSPTQNAEWFGVTIGGMGLTGAITWAELQLRPVAGAEMTVESIRTANLDEFFALSAASDQEFEYIVSWVDCLARGKHIGRGILQRANHAADAPSATARAKAPVSVPFTPPFSLVNSVSLRVLNSLLYRKQFGRQQYGRQHFQTFFFPLDRIRNWNRLYGPRGFHQYQCVVPREVARDAIGDLLETIARSGLGSFLSVLKHCGGAQSPGLLSFPQSGVTLALDFPNQPARIMPLFGELDAIVAAARGRIYPAKDGNMPAGLFWRGYPQAAEFAQYIDPRCSSTFWRRVSGEQMNHPHPGDAMQMDCLTATAEAGDSS